MNQIVEHIDRVLLKVKKVLSQNSALKEEIDILQKENIRLKKVNSQLLKEVEQINSLDKGNKSYKSTNYRSNIKFQDLKTELNQCISELDKCIELSTRE